MKLERKPIDAYLPARRGGHARRGIATGAVVTSVVCLAALGGVVTAFMKTSSPYVTIAQARKTDEDGLHLEGEIQQATVKMLPSRHLMKFDVRDANGDTINVAYNGVVPENFAEAHKVVAVGHMKGNYFESDKLLVKCPSKYEAKPTK